MVGDRTNPTSRECSRELTRAGNARLDRKRFIVEPATISIDIDRQRDLDGLLIDHPKLARPGHDRANTAFVVALFVVRTVLAVDAVVKTVTRETGAGG